MTAATDNQDLPPLPDPADIFGPGGLLETNWSEFESRPQQAEMAAAVDRALREGEQVAVEAGTGVGKTLAYLYPLVRRIFEARREADGPVLGVVATATKTLQNQIIQKDLPLLSQVLDIEVRAEIALGASNYLCPRKMEQIEEQGLLPLGAGADEYEKLKDWAAGTKDGILLDSPLRPSSPLRQDIGREVDNCLGRDCRLYNQSWYFRARRRWQKAHLLVVNHHLLAFHLASEGKLLPEFRFLIVDEAHSFPTTVQQAFVRDISRGRLERLVGPVIRGKKKSKAAGFFGDPSFGSLLPFQEKLTAYREEVHGLFDELEGELAAGGAETKEDTEIPLPPGFVRPRPWQPAGLAAARERLQSYCDQGKQSDGPAERENHRLAELFLRRLNQYDEDLSDFLTNTGETTAVWARYRKRGIHLRSGPVLSSQIIKESLLKEIPGLVFTSATLAIGTSFRFFERQLGLPLARTARIESPFPYRENARLFIDGDMPHPAREKDHYHDMLARRIMDLTDLSGGQVLVLFTSRWSLGQTLRRLEAEEGFTEDYELISQLEEGPVLADRRFRKSDRAVLLGLASFWEGVDIRGDKLRQVIITRLPFEVPSDPLLKAKLDRIEAHNINAFKEWQVPWAVIRFKQGFGRLIRSSEDRGFVSVLDSRIVRQFYGRLFLESVPPAPVVRDWAQLREAAADFW